MNLDQLGELMRAARAANVEELAAIDALEDAEARRKKAALAADRARTAVSTFIDEALDAPE